MGFGIGDGVGSLLASMPRCGHFCHEEGRGLNPWVERCPVCGCGNDRYDPKARPPDWLRDAYESLFSPPF